MKITRLLLLLILSQNLRSPAQQKFAGQRVIIIMMDGFGEAYYRQASMPFLNSMEHDGLYKIVPSLMPAVTNVNNMSIATGTAPDQNGITGNVFFNPASQKEEYIEDPSLLLVPSLFQKAHEHGLQSALLSVKRKTIDVLGKYADYTICPECMPDHAYKWPNPPALSDVYSREVNYQLMDLADSLLKANQAVRLLYIHTTDYPMHRWPPESDSVKEFLANMDRCIEKLHKTAPEAAILLTADHGMNHKSQAWDLQKLCAEKHTPVKIVISPEKDRYVKHHKGLGGSAYIYLLKKGDAGAVKISDAAAVKAILQSIPGVDSVLTREQAAKDYHLMPDRIGDFMVMGDINTVFGELADSSHEQLPSTYRSHGSTYEAHVPLFVYNAKSAPPPAYFDFNYKLAAWLFTKH